jgi:hypothetical protein
MNQTIPESEQAINNVLIIKKFLESIPVISQALAPAQSALLRRIRQLCRPEITGPTLRLILDTIRPEVTYMKTALDLQKQRTFAIQVCSASGICSDNADSKSLVQTGFSTSPAGLTRRAQRMC